MKIMVVGGGGREHAIIKKLKENPQAEEIFALPGNGGIAADATCVQIGAKDIEGMVAFAVENKIDDVQKRLTIRWCWALSTPCAKRALKPSDRTKRRPSSKAARRLPRS